MWRLGFSASAGHSNVEANKHEHDNELEIDPERAQRWETWRQIILDPEYQSWNSFDSVQQLAQK